jgi:hypothetical protein
MIFGEPVNSISKVLGTRFPVLFVFYLISAMMPLVILVDMVASTEPSSSHVNLDIASFN